MRQNGTKIGGKTSHIPLKHETPRCNTINPFTIKKTTTGSSLKEEYLQTNNEGQSSSLNNVRKEGFSATNKVYVESTYQKGCSHCHEETEQES